MSLIRRLSQLTATACIAASVAACQQTKANSAAAERLHPEYDNATGRLKRLQWDSKGDGKIDTWGYMDGAQVVRVEVDEDGDGKVDRWEYHRAPAAGGSSGPDKTIEHIERSTRHDGKVSRWEYFDETGSLARIEEDTDGDGKVNKWETYKDGALSMMALDTQGRGKPDRRLIYRPDGTLDRIETDPTGSGQFSPLPQ
jgi:hypothetical protein